MDPIIEKQVIIKRSIKDVWDYITLPERIPEWAIRISHVDNISESPLKTGSSFRTVYQLDGVSTSSSHIVTDIHFQDYIRMKVHYKTLGRTTWSFFSENVGTRISAKAEHNFGEVKRQSLAQELKRIKQVLEISKLAETNAGEIARDVGIDKASILKEHIEASILVNRPVQEIWDYMMKVDRIPEWAAGASGTVDISDIPIKVGTTFSTVYSLDGEEVKGPHKVLELTPPNIWGLQIHYTIVAFTTWKLTLEGDGTKATVSVEYNFTESGNKAVDKEVRFLKQVLETGNIPEASLRGKEQW